MMIPSTGQPGSTISEAEQMLELARRLKLKKFSFNWKDGQNLYAEFYQEPTVSVQEKFAADSMPTEDELLYWSTSYDEKIKSEAPE